MITFREYVDYAEKQLMLAEEEITNQRNADYLLIPAIILAWSAIECFVNNRLDEFDSLPDGFFTPHEKAFLTEKRLTFIDSGEKAGQFAIKGREFRRLSDKILFLLAKVGGQVDKGGKLWRDFESFKDIRDSLVHPKQPQLTTVESVRKCIKTSKDVIQFISTGWGKPVEF